MNILKLYTQYAICTNNNFRGLNIDYEHWWKNSCEVYVLFLYVCMYVCMYVCKYLLFLYAVCMYSCTSIYVLNWPKMVVLIRKKYLNWNMDFHRLTCEQLVQLVNDLPKKIAKIRQALRLTCKGVSLVNDLSQKIPKPSEDLKQNVN